MLRRDLVEDLTSFPMSPPPRAEPPCPLARLTVARWSLARGLARLTVLLTIGVGIAAPGSGVAAATSPLPSPPQVVATTVPPLGATTVPGAVAPPPPTSVAGVALAGARGGADEGSVVKPSSSSWDLRRLATFGGLAVIALAAAGYAYGKLRSAPPRHPDLVAGSPDLDSAGALEAGR